MTIPRYPDETDPEYLGDGVYGSFDGYQIWLRTERDSFVHEIAVEPRLMDELIHFAKRFYPGMDK